MDRQQQTKKQQQQPASNEIDKRNLRTILSFQISQKRKSLSHMTKKEKKNKTRNMFYFANGWVFERKVATTKT